MDLEIQHPVCGLIFVQQFSITYDICNNTYLSFCMIILYRMSMYNHIRLIVYILQTVLTIVLLSSFASPSLKFFLPSLKAWKTVMPECRPV